VTMLARFEYLKDVLAIQSRAINIRTASLSRKCVLDRHPIIVKDRQPICKNLNPVEGSRVRYGD
jgi:hypothetical protein